jgi:hypothetical protein
VFDQIGLVRAQLVALAPPEERAVRASGSAIVGRRIAIVGIAGSYVHRSV